MQTGNGGRVKIEKDAREYIINKTPRPALSKGGSGNPPPLRGAHS
jgi:hypothetical protein